MLSSLDMNMNLTEKICQACEGGTLPFTIDQAKSYLSEISPEWQLGDNEQSIQRNFRFDSFRAGIDFVNKVAELAEREGHHPDIEIHFDQVELSLTTHAIGGLSENDFIVASKVDKI